MAGQASASLAARLRSSANGMPASTGSCPTGEGCKHPVIIRRGLTSNRLVCLFLPQIGAQYKKTSPIRCNYCKKKQTNKQTNKQETLG